MASVQISSDPAPTCQTMVLEHGSLSPGRNCHENVSHGDKTGTTTNELDLLFSPMFDELLNGSSKGVSKSSAVSAADAPNQRQQPFAPLNNHTTPVPTCQNPSITTSVISFENITQAEPHAENDQVADDEFITYFQPRNDFLKSTSVTKNNVSNDFSKPVTAQNLPAKKKPCLKNTNMLAPGMYKIRTDHTQDRTSKLPQDSKKTNKSVSFSTGVIPTTSVSRPQLKSNPKGDRVLRKNSGGKKLEVEEPRRSVKLSKNKMPVTACTANLNEMTVNVKSVSAMCAKSMMINKKHDLRVPKYVAKPLRKKVAIESIKKPRNKVRKLNEHFGKTHKWTYIKFTPSGYMWKPKSKQANVNPNVNMPLIIASRTANVKDTMTSRRSTVSNTPLSSNS
nr:hypothetical protein [Tanacetum cinerariifolium]